MRVVLISPIACHWVHVEYWHRERLNDDSVTVNGILQRDPIHPFSGLTFPNRDEVNVGWRYDGFNVNFA